MGVSSVKLKRLSHYPILHQFLARLYSELDIFDVEDMYAFIADDTIASYCKCSDKACASFFIYSDRELEIDEDDGVYIYNSDKGMLVLEFFENGNIDVQALEYEHYPFKEELIAVYDNKNVVKYVLESDLEEDLQAQKHNEIKKVVSEYFNAQETKLETIIID